jgi:3-methyl-2-oxobutanoate hydroxymethyltransferase
MSPGRMDKLSLLRLAEMKGNGEKIAMVTAYDAPSARLADQAGVDLILVGDSAAMVVLGHDSTLPISLDEMLLLTTAVTRSTRRALVVGDLPFGSYQESDERAVASAVRMVKEGGADIVKLEGSDRRLSRVRAIVDAGIPVMGHIGLTPQSATMLGGYKPQGRTATKARHLHDAAKALEAANCCALVVEAVPPPVATRIAAAIAIPVIGIGAGAGCDGQVLVWHDLLGLSEDPVPRFVKRYADLSTEIRRALGAYVDDVRSGAYPEDKHTYAMSDDERERFEQLVGGLDGRRPKL